MNNELKIWAKYYYSLGFNVTCITNYITEHNFGFRSLAKAPYHKFDHLYDSRQTIEEMESYDWDNATGVGIVLGYDNVIAFDFDGCEDVEFIEEIIRGLGLGQDYEWLIRSGSHNGFHIVAKIIEAVKYSVIEEGETNEKIVWEKVPSSILHLYAKNRIYHPKERYRDYFDKLEVLTEAHLVLPPSIHKSTYEYEFVNCTRPERFPKSTNQESFTKNLRDKYLDDEWHKKVPRPSTATEPGFHFANNFKEINLASIKNLGFPTDSGRWIKIFRPLHLIVDVETDGLPKEIDSDYSDSENWPRILQIAWVVMDKEGHMLKKDSAVIDSTHLQVPEMVNLESRNIKKVGEQLRDVLRKFMRDVKNCDAIVAHNADFDLNVIQAESLRCNVLNELAKKDISAICTMKSAAALVGIENTFGYKYPKLEELYFHLFGEQIVGSHNAIKDVWATAKCFWKLKIDGIIQD